jgi:hypothetical protein
MPVDMVGVVAVVAGVISPAFELLGRFLLGGDPLPATVVEGAFDPAEAVTGVCLAASGVDFDEQAPVEVSASRANALHHDVLHTHFGLFMGFPQ